MTAKQDVGSLLWDGNHGPCILGIEDTHLEKKELILRPFWIHKNCLSINLNL